MLTYCKGSPVADMVCEAREIKRLADLNDDDAESALDRDDYLSDYLPWLVLSFGELPPRELFYAHVSAFLDGGLYEIEHQSLNLDWEPHPFSRGGSFTDDELWDGVCEAVRMFNKNKSFYDDDRSAINIASSVMATLHFEWV